jgi:hypothetical protein
VPPPEFPLVSTRSRGEIRIVQSPAADNGHAAIVRVDDTRRSGERRLSSPCAGNWKREDDGQDRYETTSRGWDYIPASPAVSIDRSSGRWPVVVQDLAQIFSRNPRGWTARSLDEESVRPFREARLLSGLDPCVIHSCYLINLAAPAERGSRPIDRRLP